jgi:FkbM family methyltransferase
MGKPNALESRAVVEDIRKRAGTVVRRLRTGDVPAAALASLEALLREFHHDDWHAADARHASLYERIDQTKAELVTLLEGHNRTTWDSDRGLHDTLLQRLAAIERSIRAGSVSAPAATDALRGIRAGVRDFLDTPEDGAPEAITVRVGDLDIEVPKWDTVIAPWVTEHGDWEPDVAAALREYAKPGSTVLDVGAHVGIFTLQLSSSVGADGRVIAVEADPINARFLRRNIMHARRTNIHVVEAAASDAEGTTTLSRSVEDNTGDSRAYDVATAGQVLEIPTVALDDLVDVRVDLIKTDAQGMDHVVLRGMRRIIDQHHPVIVMEFWPAAIREYGDDPVQVLGWLRERGYRWSAVNVPEFTSDTGDADLVAAADKRATGYVDLLLTFA